MKIEALNLVWSLNTLTYFNSFDISKDVHLVKHSTKSFLNVVVLLFVSCNSYYKFHKTHE